MIIFPCNHILGRILYHQMTIKNAGKLENWASKHIPSEEEEEEDEEEEEENE